MIRTGTVSRNAPPEPKHRARPNLSIAVEKSMADCDDPNFIHGWGCIEPWCRVHEAAKYSTEWAQHRADEQCIHCETYHPVGDPCPIDE